MESIVALLTAQQEPPGLPTRIYVPEIAPFDMIALEIEFENLEEYEKGWAEWFAAPETAEFLEQWYDLTEIGGTNQVWTLVE